MARYAIWDKTSDIYTLGVDSSGKGVWSAEDYMTYKAPWAKQDGVKVIIGGGVINGSVFMEYNQTVEFYKTRGCEITDDMTDDEVLTAIEDFEDNPPEDDTVTTNERIAAALELLAVMSMEDVEDTEEDTSDTESDTTDDTTDTTDEEDTEA